jgi:hypothetical protein
MLRKSLASLALASYLGLATAAAAPLQAGGTPAQNSRELGQGDGWTCLGCIAGGIVALSTGYAGAAVGIIVAGGPGAVVVGGAVATCVNACYNYLNDE